MPIESNITAQDLLPTPAQPQYFNPTSGNYAVSEIVPQQPKESSIVSDTGKAAATGVIGLGQMAMNLGYAITGSDLAKSAADAMSDTNDKITKSMSPRMQEAMNKEWIQTNDQTGEHSMGPGWTDPMAWLFQVANQGGSAVAGGVAGRFIGAGLKAATGLSKLEPEIKAAMTVGAAEKQAAISAGSDAAAATAAGKQAAQDAFAASAAKLGLQNASLDRAISDIYMTEFAGQLAQGTYLHGSDAANHAMETIAQMTHGDLMKSPEYSAAYQQYIDQGKSDQQAQAMAKEDMRRAAGKEAAEFTSTVALPSQLIQSFVNTKLFNGGLGGTTRLGNVGRAAALEVPANATELGAVAMGSNMGVQKYANPDLPLMHDVYNTAASAGVGALGMAGAHVFSATHPAQAAPNPLQPVADKAAEPNSPLSKAAMAGNPNGIAPDATAPAGGAAQPGADPISARVAAVDQQLSSSDTIQKLRDLGPQMGAENLPNDFLYALQVARDPKNRPDIRQQAMDQVEQAIQWTQSGYTPGTPEQPGTSLAVRQNNAVGPVGQQQFFDPNTIDGQAVRVDNMLPGPKALPGPQSDQTAQQAPTQEQATPAQAPAAAPAEQQNVAAPSANVSPTEAAPTVQQSASQAGLGGMTEVQAPRVEIPGGTGPAFLRKRGAVVKQLAQNGFETVQRDGKDFWMVNSKTGQKFKLENPADAQLARKAIKDHVDGLANTAASSPSNDLKEPTQAQIDAGNYKKSDTISLNGMQIKVENPKGSVRRGVSPEGNAWETQMAHHYGEFQGTVGADGDKLDVFVGPRPDSNKIYVVDQLNKDGSFDEHKVMMGFPTEAEARKGYLDNYEEGWNGLGAITEMSPEQFKSWAHSRAAKKPAAAVLEKATEKVAPQEEAKKSDNFTDKELEEEKDPEGTFHITSDGKRIKLQELRVSDLPKAKNVKRSGQRRELSQDDAKLLSKIAGALGKQILFFKRSEKLKSDGFIHPNYSNTIFISSEASVTPIAVFGHEFFHTLRLSNPEAWNAIASVVSTRVKDPKKFRENFYNEKAAKEKGDAPLSEEEGGELEELMSDLGGNLFKDSKFWSEVFDTISKEHGPEAKGIIAKISAQLQEMVSKIVKSFNKQSFRADDFVSDLDQIRSAFRDAVANHIKSQGMTQQSFAAEQARQAQQLRKGAAPEAASVKEEAGEELDGVKASAIPGAKIEDGSLEIPESSRDQANAELERSGKNIRLSPERASETDIERAKREYAEIKSQYEGTDQWLKAPDGSDTKLSERQWIQVRTPSFKKWFGDWEQAHKDGGVWSTSLDVSKAVGENGEPLVVYHGTDRGGFTYFNTPGGSKRGDLGIFTTPNLAMAQTYYSTRRGEIELRGKATAEELQELGHQIIESDDGRFEVYANDGYFDGVYDTKKEAEDHLVDAYGDDANQPGKSGYYALFINARNPNESDFEGAHWNGERPGRYEVVNEDGDTESTPDGKTYFDNFDDAHQFSKTVGGEVQPAREHYETTDDVVRSAHRYDQDSAVIRNVVDSGPGYSPYIDEPSDVFVALDPHQLKSANFNDGTFSLSLKDLRHSPERSPRSGQEAAIGDKTDVSKLPTGKEIPSDVAVGGLEESLKLAGSKSYRRGRDLKQDIQDRVLSAAKAAKVNLDDHTKSTFRFLSNMVVQDAKFALKSNENAVGWYDQKVSRAIGALSTIHPEINTDPRSRLAFLWALATTSNGLKVDKNFSLAEKAYRQWKETGVMPDKIGIGNAASAINKGLGLYDVLARKVGDERLLKFMSTQFTVGQINDMLGIKPGGEWMGTPVRGASVLGPKIGNGFFSNLNGYFDALTMDRWLMRTWGRMTGTLLNVNPVAIRKAQSKVTAAIDAMSPEQRREMTKLIGKPVKKGLTKSEMATAATATEKASMKSEKRKLMEESPETDRFRLDARGLHKAIDGQKEAPGGPSERNWIRAVFQDALDKLRADGNDMTMSDLQALLWYPERRLYDAAKSDDDIEAGYADDEAPDYANAAMNLALENGVSRTRVEAAMDAAEARGTVVGEQMSDAEKEAMLKEFRAAPDQQFHIAFEAAPNPDDGVATAKWNSLTDKDKAQITDLVKDAILADLSDAVGVKVGKAVKALGGFEGEVNPNVIAEYKLTGVSIEQARALAASIGIALTQKSIAIVDSRASTERGMVRMTLDKKADKHVRQIMEVISSEMPEVTSFTARGNNVDILNFTDAPTETLADRIRNVLDGADLDVEIAMSFGDVKSELVEEKDYEGQISGSRPGSGQEIIERARRARDRARQIIDAELGARSAGSVPGRPGSARRADEQVNVIRSRERDGDGGGREESGGSENSPLEASDRAISQEKLNALPGAPSVEGATGPDPRLVAVAEQYARDNGIDLRRQAEYVDVNPQRAKRIADAYAEMKHDPQNARVKEAYKNMIQQAMAQYKALEDAGYRFWFIDTGLPSNEEYASSPWNAMRDLRANQEMGVFPTADGFGSNEDFNPANNPLLEDTGMRWPVGGVNSKRTAPVLANDIFRAVHDAFGHGIEGAGFRSQGEENAYQAHRRLFTGSAVGAITSETRGQNSWLNYGPHGEKNRNAKVEDTIFADQKTGLMPEWTWNEGLVGDMPAAEPSYNERVQALEDLISCLK